MKDKKIEPAKVYIEYEEWSYGGDAEDPSDRWTHHTDTVIKVKFINLYREKPPHKFFYDSMDLPNNDMLKLDKLFLAVVRYGTGGTFGHTTGAWYIVGISPTYEIAGKMLEEECKPSPKGSYKTWEGYFESLEDTEIHELKLI